MTPTDDVEHTVEGWFAKKILWVLFAGGGALIFAGTLWAADVRNRVVNLENSRLTREEAANLKSAIDLLRMEVTYLRQAIQVVK